jgi:hypothetical protein
MRKINTNPLLPFSYDDLLYIITAEKNKASGVVGSNSRGRCNRRVDARSTLKSHSSVPASFEEGSRMSSLDPRQQKAEQVAESRIEIRSSGYSVPSQSGQGRYTVQLDPDSCECDDFQLRGKPCKHIIGLRLWLTRRDLTQEESKQEERQPSPKPKRKTYPQQWREYNLAQTRERDHFQELLAELCRTIPEPPAKVGRG